MLRLLRAYRSMVAAGSIFSLIAAIGGLIAIKTGIGFVMLVIFGAMFIGTKIVLAALDKSIAAMEDKASPTAHAVDDDSMHPMLYTAERALRTVNVPKGHPSKGDLVVIDGKIYVRVGDSFQPYH